MQILNIAGYKFITLSDLETLRAHLLVLTEQARLKGTILLSEEGINISLAGFPEYIAEFLRELEKDARFTNIFYKESYSTSQPFQHLKIKIKPEIITFKQPTVRPDYQGIAPNISPQDLKQWLDDKREFTLLDTRNDYEVRFGTFDQATNLQIDDFSELPQAVTQLSTEKPVVMFCTGGIRCEKAAWYLLNAGFPEVYQLEGGILNYFREVGGAHYHGDCFVFDERVALNAKLEVAGVQQCQVCEGPVGLCEHVATTQQSINKEKVWA